MKIQTQNTLIAYSYERLQRACGGTSLYKKSWKVTFNIILFGHKVDFRFTFK